MVPMVQLTRRPWRHAPKGPEGTGLVFLRTAGRIHARVEAALGQIGLTYTKYRLLERLRERGSPLPHPGAGTGTCGPDPGLARLLRALEVEGLIRRLPVASDGALRAVLTPLGAERTQAAGECLGEVMSEVAQALDDGATVGLRRLLTKLVRAEGSQGERGD